MNGFRGLGRLRMLRVICALSIVLSSFPLPGFAQGPSLMSYQGRLKENGTPVTGSRQVELAFCDAPAGGNCYTASGANKPLGTDAQGVGITNGLFRSTFTVSGWNTSTGLWYLEVRVSGFALTPREQLNSSPYAVYASSALTLVADVGQPEIGRAHV